MLWRHLGFFSSKILNQSTAISSKTCLQINRVRIIAKKEFLQYNRFISGDLLERLCYATEFEIEGWKKIVPLIEILEQYTNVPITTRTDLKQENDLKLKMEKFYAVTDPVITDDNDEKFNDADFIGKTIKDTEIYRHFKKSSQKLAIYVSEKIPVNEEYRLKNYCSAGNHCVIATGIADWNGGECLVLDNTTGSIEDNYIPVDFPIFEALVKKIDEDEYDPQVSDKNRSLNKYGFDLAKKKFNNIKARDFKNDGKDEKFEYQMFFVKGKRPIYKLKFLQS